MAGLLRETTLSDYSGHYCDLRDCDGHFLYFARSWETVMADILFTPSGSEATDRKIRRDHEGGKLVR
ncbi:MAG: hypothetical protein KKE42_07515, partial [Alphaproteobacteria bacterium]|nr:hypothetical protein [Alphaproteobacteria bacterium]